MFALLFFLTLIVLAVITFKLYMCLVKGINKCSKHLQGKVVIVTGGNNGIGFETAKDLADRGARVIIGCRSELRGTTARDKIRRETDNEDVHYKHLDLASLTSVRKFAEEILTTEKRLDILINNAGIIDNERIYTADGLLRGMQVNHFAPFLLTNLLLPLLKTSAPSRIITVTSSIYSSGVIEFDNLNMEKDTQKSFSTKKLYSNSKLCNVMMTDELSRRLQGTDVTANCLHPGMVETSIIDHIREKHKWLKAFDFMKFIAKDCWEGAQTTIYLAVSPEVKSVSGKYFVDCKQEEIKGIAKNLEIAVKLWEVSEKIVKLT